MQRRPSLKIVLRRRLVVTHLLAAVDQTLLHGRDAFFLFHALFYLRDLPWWEAMLVLREGPGCLVWWVEEGSERTL